MTPDLISSLLASLLSLLFAYAPGFSPWFTALPSDRKRLLLAALLFIISAASLALACSPLRDLLPYLFPDSPPDLTCTAPSAVAILRAFLSALFANQATYTLAVRRPSVRPTS